LGERSKTGFQQIPQDQSYSLGLTSGLTSGLANYYPLPNVFIFPLSGTFFQHGVNLPQVLEFGNFFCYTRAFKDNTSQPYCKRSTQNQVFRPMKSAYQLLDYLPNLFRFLRSFQSQELRDQALAFVQFIS
jgi:hypothetical protein